MENSSLGGISIGPTTLMSGPTHSFIQEARGAPTQKNTGGIETQGSGEPLFLPVTKMRFVNRDDLCRILLHHSVITHRPRSLYISAPDRSFLLHMHAGRWEMKVRPQQGLSVNNFLHPDRAVVILFVSLHTHVSQADYCKISQCYLLKAILINYNSLQSYLQLI